MQTIGMFYATRNGHTRRVAEFVADGLSRRGYQVDVRNVDDIRAVDIESFAAIILAAPVYAGAHRREMIRFVKQHRTELTSLPTAFLSVTLSQAGAEQKHASEGQRTRGNSDAQRMLTEFLAKTGWRPSHVKAVAGALVYSKYNFLIRFIMKRIAKNAGGDTDTSRDYEYTDWATLDAFVNEFCSELSPSRGMREAS